MLKKLQKTSFITSCSKSMLRILSASSMTRNFSALRLKPLVFSRWSTSLPGVAMTMCGFLASKSACVIMSIPPTTTTRNT